MSLLNYLIIILLILFCIDVIKEIYFNPKGNKNIKSKIQNTNYPNNKEIEVDEDDFLNIDKKENKIIELIIKYDRYSHEKDFILLKNNIEKDFKNIKIKGEDFPLPLNKRYFINFTYITQIGTCLLLLFPKYLKISLPFLSKNVIEFIAKYNIIFILGNFLIHFILNQHISITGAFEIMLNNNKLYSKLEMKILPDINKLKNILKNIGKIK